MAAPAGQDEQLVVELFVDSPDEQSYSALFRIFAPRVLGYYRARLNDRALAEDLTQEVMLTVFRHIRQLRDPSHFRAWLFGIARNALLQHHRKESREVETTVLTDAAAPSADPLSAARFAQWMAILSPVEREATLLRYVEGLEYHEIAAVLGVPIGTVQWRIFQSKRRLAARFGGA